MILSAAQQRVVDHRGSDLQVIACAGSGKTESIARRIAALIGEGAPPDSIVAFTFTERAATELKNRIGRRISDAVGHQALARSSPLYVGTIHAYCFRLLQDHVPKYGNYDVLDEHRHAGLLSREYRSLGLSRLGNQHWRPILDFKRTVDVIDNELIDCSLLDGTPLADVYREYRAMLDRFHFLTFGRLVAAAVDALGEPTISERVRSPLRHLIVDEYQDVNPAQERLIALLAEAPVQLCVAGDDDQSIYQWRGADVGNMVGFVRRRVQAESVTLEAKRRSVGGIVVAADAFASAIPGRLAKTMRPVRPPSHQTSSVGKCARMKRKLTALRRPSAACMPQGFAIEISPSCSVPSAPPRRR